MTDVPDNFLGLEAAFADPERARYAVLPVPYEGTVSYADGTAQGPRAIITASQQVELFDDELAGEFYEAGVATLAAVASADDPAEQMQRVRAAVLAIVQAGRFPLLLGGEHSITAPAVAACQAVCGEVSVLQIDAHADLRDAYDGSKHSHASVMRRILEMTDRIAQVGIRNYSLEEYEQCPRQVARFITPTVIAERGDWVEQVLALLGERVYVTIDIDGLDPALAPGTGTPEPDGLSWRQVTTLLRRVAAQRRIIGADVVEVRPIPPNHVTEFVAAKLAYKLIAYTQQR